MLIVSYMKLVFVTSKKTFINYGIMREAARNKEPLLVSFWHNRLMLTPLVTQKLQKIYPDYNLMTLASKHGDGRFVGGVMKKFGLILIAGSSRDGRKASRGIDFSNLKQIFSGLKNGYSLGITPDGPRGPNQKINGELVNIARISGAKILPMSCSSSRAIEMQTWDKFKIPLPFSTLCFCFDDSAIYVPKNSDEAEMKKIKFFVEERMNFVQEKSQQNLRSN